jgi:GMP synthase (glutamine-hydrolysing)
LGTINNVSMNTDVVIVDYGSQYTQLILHNYLYVICARATLITPDQLSLDLLKNVKLLILSGSHSSICTHDDTLKSNIIEEFPGTILGICYGAQLLARHLGYEFITDAGEFGNTVVTVPTGENPLLPLCDDNQFMKVWMSHNDTINTVRDDDGNGDGNGNGNGDGNDDDDGYGMSFHVFNTASKPVAWSYMCPIGTGTGMRIGLQFHPEVSHTTRGISMLTKIAVDSGVIVGLEPVDFLNTIINKTISTLNNYRNSHVLLALSGGVDSTTLAFLLANIPDIKLTCLIVDTGLMRDGEVDNIVQCLKGTLLADHLHIINAETRFLQNLDGISDPEQKRKIIGKLFAELLAEKAAQISVQRNVIISQGTIYPDVVESGGVSSQTIKSHHNVGGMPTDFPYPLLEPFRYLFKDDVRRLARLLNVPDLIINRHPFPGPGLAIRIIGEITPERVSIAKIADKILIEQLKKHDYYDKIWQAAAILLPIRTIGVKGDCRSYQSTIALRLVNSVNGMTATISRIPTGILESIATEITNRVEGVNRVVYDISTKPPATIEWE